MRGLHESCGSSSSPYQAVGMHLAHNALMYSMIACLKLHIHDHDDILFSQEDFVDLDSAGHRPSSGLDPWLLKTILYNSLLLFWVDVPMAIMQFFSAAMSLSITFHYAVQKT